MDWENGLATQLASGMPGWLAALPTQDGCVCISDPRRFAHDEAKYDEQYQSDPANMKVGRGLVALLRECGADVSGPALEVGCGTGLLSLGFAAETPFPWTIFTDPSPAFLKITRGKITGAGIDQDRIVYGVLMGEELDRLPAESLSLIALRSTLHHVLDVPAFIASAARALKPGGVLTFEEPCQEGYVLMGAMVQFLPAAARAKGIELTSEQAAQVEMFVRSMAFYARRDVDKTTAEDKHLFRVDELMDWGAQRGLEVRFMANRTYDEFLTPEGSRGASAGFLPFLRGYAKYCMSWSDDLMRVFDEVMPPYCAYIEEASLGGSAPYLHGVFVCRKR